LETKPIFEAPPARGLAPLEPSCVVSPALVVDLDGTLLKTDLLLESLLVLVKHKPLCIFLLPIWLLKGKVYLKRQIALRVELEVSVLPYRAELLNYLDMQRRAGRYIVLATASDSRLARQIADHLKIFDLVFASDGSTNLAGNAKRERLVSAFGAQRFDYVGNGRADLPVWRAARKAILVNGNPRLRDRLARSTQVDWLFEQPKRGLLDLVRPLRFRHWLKNVLLFVPLLAAQRLFEAGLLEKAILAFVAFGCCASAGYVLNDLFDLAADRHHPEKRLRPFASGDLPVSYGLAMVPILVAIGCAIGSLLSPLFLAVLLTYFALTMTYSFYLRGVVLLDVIVLAGLYTMRILAGSASISIWPSHWLLAFSTFLFLSLALVKRYGELVIMRRIDGEGAMARGYELSDAELLSAMGVASGFLAVLVLALYINSDTAQALYGRFELIWFLCPLLLYWISHIWLVAHRGKMPDDPLVFATHDRVSRILIALMAVVTVLAL
jgi:4-hydroxybenzoate polyprenyltransferase